MAIYIQETFMNETENYSCGESDVYETYTDNKGKLYKSLRTEYGRCVSKVYIDKDGKNIPVGWVFEKRVPYEDCEETYLQQVWVTLHTAPPTRTTEYHYVEG